MKIPKIKYGKTKDIIVNEFLKTDAKIRKDNIKEPEKIIKLHYTLMYGVRTSLFIIVYYKKFYLKYYNNLIYLLTKKKKENIIINKYIFRIISFNKGCDINGKKGSQIAGFLFYYSICIKFFNLGLLPRGHI